MMKKVLALAAFLFAGGLLTQAQDLPQPSPASTVNQKVGLTDVKVEYSRPGVKGRKIFGDLVPFDKVWRTGANACTKITFSTDITFAGKPVKSGTYALFTVPGKKSWEVVLNTNTKQWGAGQYDPAKNVASVTVEATKSDFRESFTIDIADLKDESASVQIAWENTSVKVPFEVPTRKMALANINRKLKEIENPANTYFASARYYLSIGENKKGLDYAIKGAKDSNRYWVIRVLAEAYAANNDYSNAIKEAKRSLELAKKAGNQDYVKINEKNIKKWSKAI
ncbi:hypothetical protein FUAX_10660 [Fulvitalea axinellae]|uniref:DUF2911 domain-containing protein n=1 Tax=Fulvitalea axinellae TaxID=1182444 RepID=A0AAU9CQF2_9BACT|nr:hypothetical protein FUAX_10660 [Fulvitalea axinellae]